jgi:hypothetical protein
MKRCQKCNFQSDAMLDYCWQCGLPLTAVSDAGQFYEGAPATQNYSLPNGAQGFSTYGQAGAPSSRSRPNAVSFGRVAAVLSGIFLFLLLIAGAGAAVIYKVVNRPPVPRYEDDYRSRQPEPVKPSAVKENPVSEKRKSDKPGAALEKIWVDYNVRENGRLGMRIHVKFSVYNMKNVDSQLAVYFEKADGTKLKSTNKKFSSKDGQVAAYRALKPGYDGTVYKDLEVFMPYEELKLGRGKYDLKMDADVIYENGDLVEHLGYHDFQYEKS